MNREHFLRFEDVCVCCGEPICEGRQICMECEKAHRRDDVIIPRREKKRGWKGWWSKVHEGKKAASH